MLVDLLIGGSELILAQIDSSTITEYESNREEPTNY